ncbi:MAG: hypothetical protein ACQESR_07860, partial [Planctomycetota bacterium]
GLLEVLSSQYRRNERRNNMDGNDLEFFLTPARPPLFRSVVAFLVVDATWPMITPSQDAFGKWGAHLSRGSTGGPLTAVIVLTVDRASHP